MNGIILAMKYKTV